MRNFFKQCGFDLFVLLAICGTLSLGTWQVMRLEWKNALIQEVEDKSVIPPVELKLESFSLQEMRFRKVLFGCNMRTDYNMYLAGRQSETGKNGYHLITPCELLKRDTVLVNRGWIPASEKDNKPMFTDKPPFLTIIQGVVMDSHLRNNLFRLNNPSKNSLWFALDAEQMAQQKSKEMYPAGRPKVLPIVVQYALFDKDDDQLPDELPRILPAKIEFYNQHRAYAVMWYSMALAFAVMYVIYKRKKDFAPLKPAVAPRISKKTPSRHGSGKRVSKTKK